MVRLAHVLTGSNAVAEDLVQDCFGRLHQRWARTTNPGAYLRVSVVNACRSASKRSHRFSAAAPAPSSRTSTGGSSS
ncbi:MAG: sigma factor [Acidimicrobiia bacterium]